MEALTGIALIFIIIGGILSILWIILPFAVFSMQGLIQRQNKILESIESHLAFQNEQIKKTHQKPHLS